MFVGTSSKWQLKIVVRLLIHRKRCCHFYCKSLNLLRRPRLGLGGVIVDLCEMLLLLLVFVVSYLGIYFWSFFQNITLTHEAPTDPVIQPHTTKKG